MNILIMLIDIHIYIHTRCVVYIIVKSSKISFAEGMIREANVKGAEGTTF